MRYKNKIALAVLSASFLTAPYSVQAAVPEPGVKFPADSDGAHLDITEGKHQLPGQTGEFYLHKAEIVKGDISCSDAALATIIEPYNKQMTNMGKLHEMTSALTKYLHQHGYPAATAYIPEQEIEHGILKIHILPGILGKVNVNNQSALSDKVVDRLLHGLHNGDKITSKKMETALYNLNGLPGVTAAGLLSPGSAVGTSDLTVTIKDDSRAQTLIYAENYGNKHTGRYRYGLQETWNNLSGQGDMLRIGGLISNKDLRNYYAAYELNTGRSGTTVGLSVSHMNYETGFEAQGFEGNADTVSLYGRTPLFHTARQSLAVTYGYDYRKLKDEMSRWGWNSERHSHSLHLGLAGEARTRLSSLNYGAVVTWGTMGLDSENARILDDIRHFSGGFTKGNFYLTAVQAFGQRFDVLFKAQGQLSNKNLDSSERMYLGGIQGVRAYPQGEASGDQGWLGSAELRYHTKVRGLTFSTYLDSGEVKMQKSMAGSTTLTGWGVGVTYSRPQDWFIRLDYARRIGAPDNIGNDAKTKGRMWFMAGKIF